VKCIDPADSPGFLDLFPLISAKSMLTWALLMNFRAFRLTSNVLRYREQIGNSNMQNVKSTGNATIKMKSSTAKIAVQAPLLMDRMSK